MRSGFGCGNVQLLPPSVIWGGLWRGRCPTALDAICARATKTRRRGNARFSAWLDGMTALQGRPLSHHLTPGMARAHASSDREPLV